MKLNVISFSTAISSLLVSFALTGCTSNTSKSPAFYSFLADQSQQDGRACVDIRDIQGYGVLKHDVISVDSREGYYLMSVLPGCMSLQTSSSALFNDNFGEVCGGGKSRIRSGGNTCTVRQVFEFSDRDEAFDFYDAAQQTYQSSSSP